MHNSVILMYLQVEHILTSFYIVYFVKMYIFFKLIMFWM